MELKSNSTLKGGKYRIEKVLGQGGFGITYLASQKITVKGDIGEIETTLNVAIKEFFMKERCNRDLGTSRVSIGSQGSVEQVNKFKAKFIKEAQNIAKLKHNNIIKVVEVFEENGTAYYVMEHIEGGPLSDIVARRGAMCEAEALRYVRQVAGALKYIHKNRINHLDVKPSNILVKKDGTSVLIDFGISKNYDDSGCQVSSTPIGASKGYAPIEQYDQGGVSSFSPSTDVYSLGATLFKLVTGITPPHANSVNERGLPKMSDEISDNVRSAITAAMQPRRQDRPQTIDEFLAILDATANDKTEPAEDDNLQPVAHPTKSRLKSIAIFVAATLIACVVSYSYKSFAPTSSGRGAQEQSDAALMALHPMSYVQGGSFQMGSNAIDANSNEQPIHKVTLSPFYIGTYEVTQQQWRELMGSNPSHSKGLNNPVTHVSWYDCIKFCNALSRKAGLAECYTISGEDITMDMTQNGYRLPTEAEWEFAARGGKKSRGYKFSGSNTIGDVAWCRDNSDKRPQAVGQKAPNELGIYDMSGNVWEWCWDFKGEYDHKAQHNPTGVTFASHQLRVIRGSGYYNVVEGCRLTCRLNRKYTSSFSDVGLRLVRRP